MQVYPGLDIHVPENSTDQLIQEMQELAKPPWRWQDHDPFGRPARDDEPLPRHYFHCDDADEPCTACIVHLEPGHLRVHTLTPDADGKIPLDDYERLLRDFDARIAEPAAAAVGGMTSTDTSTRGLSDYFSPNQIALLQHFCRTSNQSDLGTDLSDQEKWIVFLLRLHADDNWQHCDIFGRCLRAEGWWPEEGIRLLVSEYDFAMRLLHLYDEGPA